MRRKFVYKFIWILTLVAIAGMLIYPTVGKKEMEILFNSAATTEQREAVIERFKARGFAVSEKEDAAILQGRALNDAVMNEAHALPGVQKAEILKTWVEDKLLAKKLNLGLDLQGGVLLVLRANYEGLERRLERKLDERDRSEYTQQALELLRNRIDKFGVAEPSIKPSGNESIEIQLPGLQDPTSVKNIIGTTGSLEYRLVDDEYTNRVNSWLGANYTASEMPHDTSLQDELFDEISKAIGLPKNLELVMFYDKPRGSNELIPQSPMALEKEIAVAGTDIKETTVNYDDFGQIIVSFRTTADGATKFARATAPENRGKRLAIVLDNKIRNAPSINEPITTGSGQISGGFTYDEAMTLSRIIKEGALPVELQIISENVIGPSLGQDSINAGVKALAVSLISIMLFLIIYYKLAGVIAVVGLCMNFLFMMAILSLLGFTLTLPGIAGFILTVGMSIDANVIIYERIKEELAEGKSIRMAIVNGYEKAFTTIIDSNLTTIIVTFILFQFGTGPIKGFAVTLIVGVLTSMFAALYITRFFYEVISHSKRIKKLSI